MFRPAIVSTAVLCGLFLAGSVEAKNPNINPTPKFALPKPLAASRLLILPRNITVPLQDEAAEESSSDRKKKKKEKNVASRGKPPGKKIKQTNVSGVGNIQTLNVGRRTASLPDSSGGLQIPDQLKEILPGLHGDGPELARLRDMLEGLEGLGNDGSFDAFGTLFPEDETGPKDLLGGNSHTTGQRDDGDHPGHSLDDIAAGFAGQGSGDGRMPDGESGSGDANGPLHGDEERGSNVGQRGVGAFNTGLADPSSQVSQRNRGSRWSAPASCGFGCTFRMREGRRDGQRAHITERRERGGTRTTTRYENGNVHVKFVSSHTEVPSYESTSTTSADNRTMIEWRDYDNRQDVMITYVVGERGGWEVSGTTAVPELPGGPPPNRRDDQPTEEGTASGGNVERGHVGSYNVVCSATSCTYTPLSMEEIVSDMGVRINPGGMEQPSEDISTGPRITPGAVTDPHPDDAMYGRSGSRRPIGRGCAGMIRC